MRGNGLTTLYVQVDTDLLESPSFGAFCAELWPYAKAWALDAVGSFGGPEGQEDIPPSTWPLIVQSLLVNTWGKILSRRCHGNVRDVTRDTLEMWAKWGGTRGAFDQLFREHFCSGPDDGVNGWSDRYGKLATVRAQALERQRFRRITKSHAQVTPPVTQASRASVTPASKKSDQSKSKSKSYITTPLPPSGEPWLEPWIAEYRAHVGTITEPRLAKAVAGPRADDAEDAMRSFRNWCRDPEIRKFCPKVGAWAERWRTFVPRDMSQDTLMFPPRVGAH